MIRDRSTQLAQTIPGSLGYTSDELHISRAPVTKVYCTCHTSYTNVFFRLWVTGEEAPPLHTPSGGGAPSGSYLRKKYSRSFTVPYSSLH
jgi:hypothetical protein